MTNLKNKLERIVRKELETTIIPVKTDEGILVGSVLIVSEGSYKNLYRNGECLYKDISLNIAAIKIANIMAKHRASMAADKIYAQDKEYARWYLDSQILLKNYYSACKKQDFDRADMLWARYQESRHKAMTAKENVSGLASL